MKTFTGKVKSLKMDKTAVVVLESQKPHRLYKKLVKRRKNLKVHNEKIKLAIGDRVKFKEVKPISKDKKWVIIEKL